MKKKTTLTRFVKDECANYNKHYQTCLDDKPCKVLSGKQCSCFERAVLGKPDYKYKLPNYDYQKLFAQYAELTETEAPIVLQRRCPDCGDPLKPRQRFCDKCAEKRRKISSRQAQREYHKKQRLSA